MEAGSGIIVWATATQAPLVAAVARRLDRPVRFVGGPHPSDVAPLRDVADVAEPFTDLRHTLRTTAEAGENIVLLAARGRRRADVREAVRAVRGPVLSLEPPAGTLADANADRADSDDDARHPLLAWTDPWRAVRDRLGDFGPIRLVEASFTGRTEHGSLHARLHDACDAIDRAGLEVHEVAAATGRGPRGVPDDLHEWTGSVAVRLGGHGGWCGTIAASDEAGTWSRRVILHGEGGRISVDDASMVWTDASGITVETFTPDTPATSFDAVIAARHAAQTATSADAETAPPASEASRERRRRRFSLCETVRLAARTGESERPSRVAEML
ncbi:MAG: hypothetical protein AB8G96_00555 [Phycisphaerales bacterium]